MTFIRFLTLLLLTFFTLCCCQEVPTSRFGTTSWRNQTSALPRPSLPSRSSLPPSNSLIPSSAPKSRISSSPPPKLPPVTPKRASSSAPSRTSSAPPTTVTVSNGEIIAVAAGVVVVGGVGGGLFTLNGVTTAVPAGAAVTAGSTAQNPENPDDPGNEATKNPEQQTPSKAPSNAPSSSVPASTSGSPTTSSAAPTGTAAEYMIFVNRNTTKADADGFGNTLKTIVGDQPLNSIVDENGIAYMWRTKLRPDQLEKVKADRVVVDVILYQKGTVEKDPTPDPEDKDPEVDPALGPSPSGTSTVLLAKRADYTQLPTTKNKLLDLRTLSTPPQTNGILPNFFYEDPAGEGITVYHVDIGKFAMDHDEFKTDVKATRETIELNLDKEDRVADADHGTCAASKIVGQGVGTAKRAGLVTVRIDEDVWGVIEGLQAAAKDLRGKAVVSIAVGVETEDATVIEYFREVLQSLKDWDIPVVCPSGNNGVAGQTVQVNEYPALFANDFPVIVVGSTSRRLEKSWFSQQGNLLTIWAVGENVRCASSTNLAGLKFETGASFAGPQVAGIAAYFMSHPDFNKGFRKGSVAADVRDLIGATSFPRITHEAGYPSMAWNLWGSQQACSVNGGGSSGAQSRVMRRALEGRQLPACSLAPSSAPATAAPTAAPSVAPSGIPNGGSPTTGGPATTTVTSPAETATGPPSCGVCGAQVADGVSGEIGGQVGCQGGIPYAHSSCEGNANCKSWAIGQEDRGTYSIQVCLFFDQNAPEMVSQAPADPEGKCPFKYYDKACPEPAS
ncbi:alkaline serine protease [Colletotrichum kahawae]|uniref:Alkaline serine protease n=1 Tax=Colletotrichum kahawae TaxID=34407 RepID=A0AAD9Y7M4_COLKA|nr:alkaline serine protease [Colletotrichum kahawae]